MDEGILTTESTTNEQMEIHVESPKQKEAVINDTVLIVDDDHKEEVKKEPIEASSEENSPKVEETKKEEESMELRIKRVLKEYDKELSEDDIDTLISLMEQINKGNTSFLFAKLPKIIQKRVLSTLKNNKKNPGGNTALLKEKLARDYLSFFADNIIKFVWADALKNQSQQELDEDKLPPIEDEKLLEEWKAKKELNKISKDIDDLLKNSFKEAFENIEEIEKEDPARAERIKAVKSGFEHAENFQELIDYIDNDSPRNIKRYHQHYNSDTELLHNYLATNCFKIAAPSTSMMYDFLRQFLDKKYTTDDIKGFITLLSRMLMQQNVNDLEEFAFVFKLLSNIYCINATPNQREIIINNIAKVIDYMITKKGGK